MAGDAELAQQGLWDQERLRLPWQWPISGSTGETCSRQRSTMSSLQQFVASNGFQQAGFGGRNEWRSPPTQEAEPKGSKDQGADQGADQRADSGDERAAALANLQDLASYIHSFGGVFLVLPQGSFGEKFPFQCRLYRSRRWPTGKAGDLTSTKVKVAKHFLKQHIASAQHQRCLAQQADAEAILPDRDRQGPQTRDCRGLYIDDEANGKVLYKYRNEFCTWASMSNLPTFGTHKHNLEASTGRWHVRSQECLKTVSVRNPAAQGSICNKCLQLGNGDSIVRSAQRFCLKLFLAEVLSARLFAGDCRATGWGCPQF